MDGIAEKGVPEQTTLSEIAIRQRELVSGKKIQEVKPDQDFSPFEKSSKRSFYVLNLGPSRVLIEIEPSYDMPVSPPYFSPLDRSIGHSVDNRDYDWETRRIKLDEYLKTNDWHNDSSLPMLSIRADINQARFHNNREDVEAWYAQIKQVLKRVKLQIQVGGFQFQSRVDQDAESGPDFLRFHEFYPIDSRSLAVDPKDPRGEGLEIVVPNDPGKLKHIEMRFVRSDQKPQEDIGDI